MCKGWKGVGAAYNVLIDRRSSDVVRVKIKSFNLWFNFVYAAALVYELTLILIKINSLHQNLRYRNISLFFIGNY